VIDAAESEYRSRVQSNYKEPSVVGTTVTTADPPAPRLLTYKEDKASTVVDDYTVDPPAAPVRSVYKKTTSVVGTTVDPPRPPRLTRHQKVDIVEETVEAPRFETKSKMGYYDEDGKLLTPRDALTPTAQLPLPNLLPLPEGDPSQDVAVGCITHKCAHSTVNQATTTRSVLGCTISCTSWLTALPPMKAPTALRRSSRPAPRLPRSPRTRPTR
jgi:hypothetical protein